MPGPSRRHLLGAGIGALSGCTTAPEIAAPPDLIRIGPQAGPLAAWISPGNGGELSGLELIEGGKGRELLYRGRDYADRPGWRGKAMMLWPATGRNIAAGATPAGDGEIGSWVLDGRQWPMPIHGFARNAAWSVRCIGSGRHPERVRLSLADNAATRAFYPFGFSVETEYAVRDRRLLMHQMVRAATTNSGPMPFSIGNHITFALPLALSGDARAVRIASPATRRIELTPAGYPTGRVIESLFTETRVGDLAPRTAISLSGYQADNVRVRLIDPAGLWIELSHRSSRWPAGDAVLFNLWGDVKDGFFSPEPWVGKQNALASGDGCIWLAPGETWTWTITVAVGA